MKLLGTEFCVNALLDKIFHGLGLHPYERAKAAAVLGLNPDSITNWRTRNSIPLKSLIVLALQLRKTITELTSTLPFSAGVKVYEAHEVVMARLNKVPMNLIWKNLACSHGFVDADNKSFISKMLSLYGCTFSTWKHREAFPARAIIETHRSEAVLLQSLLFEELQPTIKTVDISLRQFTEVLASEYFNDHAIAAKVNDTTKASIAHWCEVGVEGNGFLWKQFKPVELPDFPVENVITLDTLLNIYFNGSQIEMAKHFGLSRAGINLWFHNSEKIVAGRFIYTKVRKLTLRGM
ncbi:hypothetical protein [Shewanella glacialipiscicola]|uniref:hypothetical protein n=1 Tax=Shewanella glacialipiscicola TaxID=614069 RepID=UPI003D792828